MEPCASTDAPSYTEPKVALTFGRVAAKNNSADQPLRAAHEQFTFLKKCKERTQNA